MLDPLIAYMLLAKAQYNEPSVASSYNIGPNDEGCVTTGDLVDLFTEKWGDGLAWINKSDGGPHEATFLKLDCTKFKRKFGWEPRLDIEEAVTKTVEWTKNYLENGDIQKCMDEQIKGVMK